MILKGLKRPQILQRPHGGRGRGLMHMQRKHKLVMNPVGERLKAEAVMGKVCVLAGFCQLDTKLDVSEKRES